MLIAGLRPAIDRTCSSVAKRSPAYDAATWQAASQAGFDGFSGTPARPSAALCVPTDVASHASCGSIATCSPLILILLCRRCLPANRCHLRIGSPLSLCCRRRGNAGQWTRPIGSPPGGGALTRLRALETPLWFALAGLYRANVSTWARVDARPIGWPSGSGARAGGTSHAVARHGHFGDLTEHVDLREMPGPVTLPCISPARHAW